MRTPIKKIKSKLNEDFTSEKDYESKFTNRERQVLQLKKEKERNFKKVDEKLAVLIVSMSIIIGISIVICGFLLYNIFFSLN